MVSNKPREHGFPNSLMLFNTLAIHRAPMMLPGISIILVYVDDLVLTGNDDRFLQRTKTDLAHMFDMKDSGPARYGSKNKQTTERRLDYSSVTPY